MAERQRTTPGPGEVLVHIAAGEGATREDALAALDRARAQLTDDTAGFGGTTQSDDFGPEPENRYGIGTPALPGFALTVTWPR